jgi:hypothetical protein
LGRAFGEIRSPAFRRKSGGAPPQSKNVPRLFLTAFISLVRQHGYDGAHGVARPAILGFLAGETPPRQPGK